MNERINRLGKYALKILIAELILIGLSFLITLFTDILFIDSLVYIGFLCILIGGLSRLGNGKHTRDAAYFMAKSVEENVTEGISEEVVKNRNSSLSFFAFMTITGGLLMALDALIVFVFM